MSYRGRGGGRGGGGRRGGGGGGGRRGGGGGGYDWRQHVRPRGGGGGGGRGGRGGGRGGRGGSPRADGNGRPQFDRASGGVRSFRELEDTLRRIDGKQYPAYKDLLGFWELGGGVTLGVDHVQGDAYAAPSRFHVSVPAAIAQFPRDLYCLPVRKRALCDFLARVLSSHCDAIGASRGNGRGQGWNSAKGGELGLSRPSQHVIYRSSVVIDERTGAVEARFTVALPAQGRRILGHEASRIILNSIPELARAALIASSPKIVPQQLRAHVDSVHAQDVLRRVCLPAAGLVAFVRNGAVLPRLSGASDRPMASEKAVAFKSPDSMLVRIVIEDDSPGAALFTPVEVEGMGVPAGITLICGGGYHGKSTLLRALELGVYDKVPGDGREFVCCDASAVKIRAEDGRNVAGVDIQQFISNLPFKKDTQQFSSTCASGSTSQAAAISEALEVGSRLLLLDEVSVVEVMVMMMMVVVVVVTMANWKWEWELEWGRARLSSPS